jgi:hypothetical protein
MKEITTIDELSKFDWSEDVKLVGIKKFDIILKNNINLILIDSSPTVVAYGSSSPRIVAYGSSSPRIVANDSSSPRIEANGSSSPRIVAYGSSSPRIEAYDSSSPRIEAYDSSKILHIGIVINLECYANSLFITQNKEFNSDRHIIIQHNEKYNFFERHGIKKADTYIFYKKVSKCFKTQENTKNETLWLIGSTVTHKEWNPTESECGKGKFHAVVKPHFADEFRNEENDKYIAIQIKADDLYEWENNPNYPHKIGFREGFVLYECDVDGKEISPEIVYD